MELEIYCKFYFVLRNISEEFTVYKVLCEVLRGKVDYGVEGDLVFVFKYYLVRRYVYKVICDIIWSNREFK